MSDATKPPPWQPKPKEEIRDTYKVAAFDQLHDKAVSMLRRRQLGGSLPPLESEALEALLNILGEGVWEAWRCD